jgi:hypothetical protein
MGEHTFGINTIEFGMDTAYLRRDSVDQWCPFFGKNCQGVPVRCGNWCPHFKLRKNGDRMVLTLTCGNGAPTMTIEGKVEQ